MIVAVDVGLKRIGVAIEVNALVLPIDPILRKNREQAAKDLSTLLKEKRAAKLIVGIPLGGSSEEEMQRRIRHFISLLDFDGEIFYQDESYSSFEVSEEFKGKNRDRRDGKRDSLAAKIIMERWLCNNL